MTGITPAVDDNRTDWGAARVADVELLEAVLTCEFFPGLLCPGGGGAGGDHAGLEQRVFHVAPAFPGRLAVGAFRGDLGSANHPLIVAKLGRGWPEDGAQPEWERARGAGIELRLTSRRARRRRQRTQNEQEQYEPVQELL